MALAGERVLDQLGCLLDAIKGRKTAKSRPLTFAEQHFI